MENNIYKSIALIIGDIKAIGKEHKNSFQGYMFRGIDDVYNAVNGLLAKHKVCIFPRYKVISETIGETKKGAEQKNVVIEGLYKFVAEDGSYEEVITIGEASDTSDKAYNKAMSTAFKYALFQVFCIPTEEEKDTEHKSPEVTKPKKTTPPKQPTIREIYESWSKKAQDMTLAHYKRNNVESMTKEDWEDLKKTITEKKHKDDK